jgi:hypothetical protein
MRVHAASRSLSLTPSTWLKRATAFRTCLASPIGSFFFDGNANVWAFALVLAIGHPFLRIDWADAWERSRLLPALRLSLRLAASGFAERKKRVGLQGDDELP